MTRNRDNLAAEESLVAEAEKRVVKAALRWYRAQYSNNLSRGYSSEGTLARACARLYEAQGKERLEHPEES